MFYGNGQTEYFPLIATYFNIKDLVVREGYPFRVPILFEKFCGLFPELLI